MIKAGHKYEFKSAGGVFIAYIFGTSFKDKTIDAKGIICNSFNKNYKIGDTFIIDSPLTITYREVYPNVEENFGI